MNKILKLTLLLIVLLTVVGCQNKEDKSTTEVDKLNVDVSTEKLVVQSSTNEFDEQDTTQLEETTQHVDSEDQSNIGYEDFLRILNENDLEFIEEDSKGDNFLSVNMKTILIGEEIIGVYEYDDKDLLEADASGISKDGCSISIEGKGGVEISWVSYPHFYKNNKLIVSYVGEDKIILQLLNDIFGSEFAGYNFINNQSK